MNTLSYKTAAGNSETADKKWLVVDAENQPVGRLGSKIAKILRGKHKTNFTPHADCGDFVIVVNADKVVFTGKKMDQKQYIRHTGYPGGQRFDTPRRLMAKHPERIIEKAVKGMLPRNRLGRQIFGNLFIYVGAEHPHEAQKPQKLDVNTIR